MLHYFNPGHEAAVLNGSPYYHPPANTVQMQNDLAFLPAWYARSSDYVLLQQPLGEAFSYFYTPLTSLCRNTVHSTQHSLTDEQAKALNNTPMALWGISPQAICFLHTNARRWGISLQAPPFGDIVARFAHRQQSAICLQQLRQLAPDIPTELDPRFFHKVEDVEALLKQYPTQLFLAKAPYSSSGRGLLWLPPVELTRTERQILHGILNKQQSVSVELVWDKVLDFAMEFYCDGEGNTTFEGYSLFTTNTKGAYAGNCLLPQPDIEQQLVRHIPAERLQTIRQAWLTLLSSEVSPHYRGYVGVDMLVYRHRGGLHLHPCVEVNLRCNMGIVSIALQQKHLHPQAQGHFSIRYTGKIAGDALRIHQQMTEKHPAIFSNGRMLSGYFPLCPVSEETHYLAFALLHPKEA